MIASQQAPTADQIAALGEAVLRELPDPIRAAVAHLPVKVADWADDETLDAMGIDDPLELTGLYAGVPLGERQGLAIPPSRPEMIHLYRLPILFEWCERGCTLEEVVFDVLTHEIGHHFGMDEATVLRMEGRSEED